VASDLLYVIHSYSTLVQRLRVSKSVIRYSRLFISDWILLIVDIQQVIVCPHLRQFYDKHGEIIPEKLVEMVADQNKVRIFSWFLKPTT